MSEKASSKERDRCGLWTSDAPRNGPAMKEFRYTYDAVCSLGQWCATAMLMKKLGLRSWSGPFDWFLGRSADVAQYVDLIMTGASGFMLRENLREDGGCEADKAIYYMDAASGLESRHDFKVGIPFDESYVKFRARLDRRIERLLACLRSGGKVLLVHWFGEGRCRRDETVDAMHRLRAAFPDTVIDLLVIETEKFAKGVVYEEAEPGIDFAVGDFYDQSRFDPVVGNEKLALSVLGEIRLHGRWRNLLRMKKDAIRKRLLRIFG